MYKYILYSIFTFILTSSIYSQSQEVIIKINHFLGEEIYESGLAVVNNMNQKFMLKRLEYYLSEFSVIHDGGQETKVEDLWAHVNANDQTTIIDLGPIEVEEIEGIVFFIGVDPDHNHLDPTSWPSSHPLAPKSPSMHWGWAAGYRFVALEGFGGENLNHRLEIHGLGDKNYGKTTIDLSSITEEGKEVLYVNADYTNALADINVQNGLIVHSENLQAQACLNNFKRLVFSSGNTTSTDDTYNVPEVRVFPNPSNGNIKIELIESENLLKKIKIIDINGSLIKEIDRGQLNSEVHILSPGQYIMRLEGENGLLGHKQITIQK